VLVRRAGLKRVWRFILAPATLLSLLLEVFTFYFITCTVVRLAEVGVDGILTTYVRFPIVWFSMKGENSIYISD